MRNRDTFSGYHPTINFLYFALVLLFSMCLMHPVYLLISLIGALAYDIYLKGRKAVRFAVMGLLPMAVIAALVNPAFNHEGQTMLTYLPSGNPLTLESILYGVAAAVMLASVVLWFSSYNEVMTSDKFLYLFGKVAPVTALLITSALRFIPQMQQNAAQIKQSRAMLQDNSPRLFQKLAHAVQNLSALLGMSMENAVQTADSMKARGFGARRRTTFHLFRFDARDARTLALILMLSGICVVARCYGHGYMEYYPRITALTMGPSSMTMFILFAALMLLPSILEAKEAVVWRSYGLIR